MLLMIPLSYNIRSLFVRKTTTIATAFGIALVVFVLASSQMLSEGVRRTLVSSGTAGNAIVLRKGADTELASTFESNQASLVSSSPGVKKGEGGKPLASNEVVVVIALDIAGAEGQVANVLVRGVTEEVRKVRSEVHVVEGTWPRPGTDEVMVGKSMIGRYKGLELNGTFDLKKNRPMKVVGVFASGGSSFESEAWADIDVLRSSFGREGLVSSVTVQLDSPEKFDVFKATVESDKQLGLEALAETKYYENQSNGTSAFIKYLGIVITFFFGLGAIIGATITMHAAVSQRQREIGTLRALGFSRFSILFSFVVEAIFLSLLGGVVGLLCALCMSFAKFSMVNFATWQQITFSFDATPSVLASSLVVGVMMGLVGGFFPAIRAARVSPIEAMRAEPGG